MIADIRFWEQKASEGHYAIPHFNVWNAEMLMGVIDAAESSSSLVSFSRFLYSKVKAWLMAPFVMCR